MECVNTLGLHKYLGEQEEYEDRFEAAHGLVKPTVEFAQELFVALNALAAKYASKIEAKDIIIVKEYLKECLWEYTDTFVEGRRIAEQNDIDPADLLEYYPDEGALPEHCTEKKGGAA